MKRCITGAIIYALLIGSAFAADAYVLRDDGLYVLKADSMSLEKVAATVVDQRTGAPPPTPGPGPTPQPPTTNDVAKRSETEARKVNDPYGATVLAATYEMLSAAKLVPNAYAGDNNALTRSLDTVLAAYEIKKPGSKAAWAPFRASMTDLLNEQRSKGKLNTTDDWVRDLHDISVGLTAAGGSNAQVVMQALAAMVREYQKTGEVTAASMPANVEKGIEDILLFIQQILPLIMQIISLFFGGF